MQKLIILFVLGLMSINSGIAQDEYIPYSLDPEPESGGYKLTRADIQKIYGLLIFEKHWETSDSQMTTGNTFCIKEDGKTKRFSNGDKLKCKKNPDKEGHTCIVEEHKLSGLHHIFGHDVYELCHRQLQAGVPSRAKKNSSGDGYAVNFQQ